MTAKTDEFANADKLGKASRGGFTSSDFLLGPKAFVDRCAEISGVSAEALGAVERELLAEAIRTGTPRLSVIRAIDSKRGPVEAPVNQLPTNSYALEWDNLVVVDLLVRYAPENDDRFIQQVYAQVLDREPTPMEALEARFDLAGQRIDRQQFIADVASRSQKVRLSTESKAGNRHSSQGPLMTQVAGLTVDIEGKQGLNFVQNVHSVGWIIQADMWHRNIVWHEESILVPAGWVVVGPKRSLEPGQWQLDVDLVQHRDAELVVDVVANAGLDTLWRVHCAGSTQLSARFEIKACHNFIEVRLWKPDQAAVLRQLKPRHISLHKV